MKVFAMQQSKTRICFLRRTRFHPSPLPLSPLRGEGAALGDRDYSDVMRHGDDGGQRTARPTDWSPSTEGASPLGLARSGMRFPRAASLARQPWALGRNPFGIGRENQDGMNMGGRFHEARIKARGCVGVTGLNFLGEPTWACARQTGFSPGYQITGFQPQLLQPVFTTVATSRSQGPGKDSNLMMASC
jgi:hypothetical protein